MNRAVCAFDFLVARVVQTIDMQLSPTELGWKPCEKGFNYNIEHINPMERRLAIIPIGWPTGSCIGLRAPFKSIEGDIWWARAGMILAPHLPAFEGNLSFEFHDGCPPFITPQSSNERLSDIVRAAAVRLRPDINISDY